MFAALAGAASVPWLWLSYAAIKGRIVLPWTWVVVAGIALRLFVQVAEPAVLSDDIHRYIWEGRIQLAGHNPFVESPESLAEIGRGDPHWEKMNNRAITAAYPPVGQLFLRAVAWTGADQRGFRAAFALCDVLVLVLLVRWLAMLGKSPGLAVVHALCPLALIEFGAEGHNDALAIALSVASLAVLDSRARRWRTPLAAVLLGAAISSKLLPAVLLPWVFRRDKRVAVIAVCVFVASYMPFWPGIDRVPELFEGLRQYGARWRSNDSLFIALRFVTEQAQDWMRGLGVTGFLVDLHQDRIAKIPLAVILLGLLVLARRRIEHPAPGFVVFLLGLFAVTPTLHPWYVCWILPFLALRPEPAGFALLATAALSYHVLAGWHSAHVWHEDPWIKVIEFAPFYAALVWSIAQKFRWHREIRLRA